MNVQPCARCGYVVYPAEKINCIGQNWHKACFHCEVCKMVLTANNFISHQKRPYCQVHNPKNNTFTSVYETPVNINAKKQSEAVSEIKYREEGERFMSTFHYDMRSKEVAHARSVSQLASQVSQPGGSGEMVTLNAYKAEHEEQKTWFSGTVSSQEVMCMSQEQKITGDVEYKRGHEERVSKFTSVSDTPEILLAKTGGKLASEVKYHQKYEREMKGKGCSEAGAAEIALARENLAYTEEYEQRKGKGSFPAMITPAYQVAKKAHALASDLKYKKDLSKVKGSALYHTMTTEDNLALKSARKVNKLVSEVEYKKDLENTKGHSINYCETPQFKNTTNISKYTSDNKYKEKYTNHMKGHYEGCGPDRRTLHAMKVRNLASNKAEHGEYNYPATITPSYQTQRKLDPLKDVNYRQHIDKVKFSSVTDTPDIVQARINAQQISDLSYRADYEKTKTQYTLPQDLPQIRTAKANAELYSDIKYKENWEKTKSKACDIGVDTLTVRAAKASRDLASDIKYKESFVKNKDKAVGVNVSDSKTLHSLKVAKMSSEIAYKKDSKKTQSKFHLPLDMVHLNQAKKAQALASDLDYRKKLHEYTVLPDDMKVQWAKKAYNLQSENLYRSDLNWMKGVGWEADGCMEVKQAKKAVELASENKYRQKVDKIKFTQVADTLSLKHAKKSQELQSGLAYKANTAQTLHQYSMSKDEPLFLQAKANAELLSEKVYRSSWEKQRDKGFELRLDAVSFVTAKAKRDLASDVKYKQEYEKMKGKMIGVKGVRDDAQLAHSTQASRLQSDREYRRGYEDGKARYSASLDMLALTHARKAQDLATDTRYRSVLHQYTTLPTDLAVTWARKAYVLQSDKLYRSDLNWMKGVGWATAGSLDVEQAKKAGDLVSEVVKASQQLYREQGENMKHRYTLTGDLPEHVQAKINAMNLSETRYKESWTKLRDSGYRLRLDAIPFQAAKISTEILSDHKYKEEFEKMKGRMIGLKGLEDDINISHYIHAGQLQSNDSLKERSKFHLSMDMLEVTHARKAQALVSDQDYRLALHSYTSLPDDLKLQAAKKAYNLQSEKLYRSDLNFLRGAAWISTGAVQIEGSKRATDLISEKKYRQQPYSFKHTSIADSPDIVHAKFSSKVTNERLYKEAGENARHNYTMTAERPELMQAKINAANFSEIKYRESWHNLRAQGYKLTMQDIPFQAAKTSGGIASDYQYKHNFLKEKGKCIGARSILDDPRMLHCLQVGKLQSDKEYRKESRSASGQYHLSLDMVHLSQARKAQALASDLDYRKKLHEYTVLPDDMKVQWAKKAYNLQSEKLYRSDLNFMKGVAWMTVGTPQLESARKAGELISEKKYRQLPDSLKFTSVTDSPDIIHAKNSYLQCSERLYKSGDSEALHRYTLPPDHPDFIRARLNAQHISDKIYKTSGEQVRSAGYDLRLDAIPFQTAKASREIASDFRYKEAFVRDKGHQVGLRCVEDDPKMRHSLAVSKLQSSHQYKKQSQEERSHYRLPADQPQFLQARKSQAQASDLSYRQRLHQYTCDPEQLAVKHAKRAQGLQSDLTYKSDLNWIRGVGWTPPGSHKVEMARRAAELGLAEGLDPEQAIARYQQLMFQQPGVNPDAMEILHVKRKKTIHTVKKATV
uniref:Nebulin-related anchoring protein n=1 Tax=Scleropages formosus TaxID=113540 RepID=A0A8C9WK66_SCLFO